MDLRVQKQLLLQSHSNFMKQQTLIKAVAIAGVLAIIAGALLPALQAVAF